MPVDHRADATRLLGRNATYATVAALAQKRRGIGAALAQRGRTDRHDAGTLATAVKTVSRGGPTGRVSPYGSGLYGALTYGTET